MLRPDASERGAGAEPFDRMDAAEERGSAGEVGGRLKRSRAARESRSLPGGSSTRLGT